MGCCSRGGIFGERRRSACARALAAQTNTGLYFFLEPALRGGVRGVEKPNRVSIDGGWRGRKTDAYQ